MILFQKDWDKFPGSIIHTSTTNESWVRLASVYRSMGIKNHAFILALNNPSLIGVDPFDPRLTEEQILMIAHECYWNPWYYFREVARAPAISGVHAMPLQANRANIALFWAFYNHITFMLIQPRQTGKSFSTDSLMVNLTGITGRNLKINLLTKDDQLRRQNIERIKNIMECLPYYLNLSTRGDANNGEEVTIKALKNSYHTHVPQMNPMRALNAGRGLTSSVFCVDEGPFQPNIDISLPAALPAMGAAVERAKANNEPYGVIMTTTSGKLNDKSGAFFYDLLQKAAIWDERFFDAENEEELYELVLKSSRNSSSGVPMINGTFSHRQLGKTDDWLRKRIAESLQKGEDAERDFLNRWTSGGTGTPFSKSVVERISNSKKDVKYMEIHPKYKYITRWYIDEAQIAHTMANRTFILGMDSSDASGGDFIGLTLTDTETLNVVASATLNDLNLYSFIEWIADFLARFKNVTFMPERRSTGQAIIDGLLILLPKMGEDPFKRIFNWIVQDPVKHQDKYREITKSMLSRSSDIYTRYKALFGFGTSGGGETSRARLFGTPLNFGTGKFAECLNDSTLVDQLLGLREKNGRIDHASSGHDDMVVAWLLSIWLLINGVNLDHYGIDTSRILIEPIKRDNLTQDERNQQQEQAQLRKRIAEVAESLGRERDDTMSRKLERELLVLEKRLILENDETFSMHELIQKANEVKNQARTKAQQAMQYGGGLGGRDQYANRISRGW